MEAFNIEPVLTSYIDRYPFSVIICRVVINECITRMELNQNFSLVFDNKSNC